MSKSDIIKKVVAYVIPLITLIAFLTILASVGYFQTYSEAGKRIPKSIDQVEKFILRESWEEAVFQNKDLQNDWDNLTPIIQISTTEEDIREFSKTLVRLEGYLKGKEKGSALAEIGMLRFMWGQLEN